MDVAQKGFDFSVRIAELVRFLREDGRDFPLEDQLLECGVGVGLACRALAEDGGRPPGGGAERVLELLQESDYLLEMAVRAGYLTQRQSVHIREDARTLLEQISEMNGRITQ